MVCPFDEMKPSGDAAFYSHIRHLRGVLGIYCLMCHHLPKAEPLWTHVVLLLPPLVLVHTGLMPEALNLLVRLIFVVLLSVSSTHESKIIRAMSVLVRHIFLSVMETRTA